MELKDINPAVADHLTQISKQKNGAATLYPPATDFALKVEALFRADPDVYVFYEEPKHRLHVLVKGSAKRADAINWLLGKKKHDFKVEVGVVYIRENGEYEVQPSPTYDIAGEGIIENLKLALKGIGFGYQFNDVFVPLTQTTYHFLEIEAEPIAIPNDNFGNPYGFSVMLACDLLCECFETGGLMVTTYVRKDTGEISSGAKGSFGYAFTW